MLELRDIHKSYDGQVLLRGISFRVGGDDIVCLLGPSGSGKSTILQLIAGLDSPEGGQILWGGRDLAARPAHLRDFGLVFQDYALFPHLDVYGNVAFGPRMKSWPPSKIDERVNEVLDLVNLSGFRDRRVNELSGGEQQRVALARALAPRPRLLMFDEPLAALDRALREELLSELRAVLSRAGIPSIYVTHDQEEAFKIGDRIMLLHDGLIVREGMPQDLWDRPGSRWAAEFLGLGFLTSGRVASSSRRVQTPLGTIAVQCEHKHKTGDFVHALLRPEPARSGTIIKGIVRDVTFEQNHYRVYLSNGVYYDSPRAPRGGSRQVVRLRAECLGSEPGSNPPTKWSYG